jgi:hypothetical protein
MTKSNNESEILKLTRLLASVIRFFVSADYIKFRIWVLIFILAIFLITGQLFTETGLTITLIIAVYILLTYFVKWSEKRDE